MQSLCRQIACFALVLFAGLLLAQDQPAAPEKPLIQLAILLDTSNSMDGLIDQARTQLWSVVNELALTKRDGQTPRLEVALFEYGNQNLDAGEGYVRMVLPLSDDLDAVSEKLFGLTTNGGDEWCGWVIRSGVEGLTWSQSPDAYKTIFVAGNEAFTQGSVDFRPSIAAAKEKGIIVNTIYCGDEPTGTSTGWKDGAVQAGGSFMCIDQDQAVIAIAAPQDEEITKLSAALNDTYIAYGMAGADNLARQSAQDAYAATLPASGAPVQRAVAKSTALYSNVSWDIVDAVGQKELKLEELKDEDLPENMRGMTPEQRQKYVEEQAAKRGEIQQKIQALNAEREQYVAEKRREQAAETSTLDSAMVGAVRQQLADQKFEVPRE